MLKYPWIPVLVLQHPYSTSSMVWSSGLISNHFFPSSKSLTKVLKISRTRWIPVQAHASCHSWWWTTTKFSLSIVFYWSHRSFMKAMFSYLAFKIIMWSKFTPCRRPATAAPGAHAQKVSKSDALTFGYSIEPATLARFDPTGLCAAGMFPPFKAAMCILMPQLKKKKKPLRPKGTKGTMLISEANS